MNLAKCWAFSNMSGVNLNQAPLQRLIFLENGCPAFQLEAKHAHICLKNLSKQHVHSISSLTTQKKSKTQYLNFTRCNFLRISEERIRNKNAGLGVASTLVAVRLLPNLEIGGSYPANGKFIKFMRLSIA